MNKHIGKSYDKVDSKGILTVNRLILAILFQKMRSLLMFFVALMHRRALNQSIHLKLN